MSLIPKSLVVIPARGGSKRLPHKNWLDLGGKPLISHTIEAALGSDCFSSVLVTTDDPKIAEIARTYPSVMVDDRDPLLASDTTKVVEVIANICNRDEIRKEFDVIAMMLPTAPFRTRFDIHQGCKLFEESIDSVVSFAPYDFPPQMAITLSEDSLMTPIFEDSPLITGNTRSQDQVSTLRPNGSFYISWIESFKRNNSFFLGQVKGVEMSRINSIDIDELEDLELARQIISAGLCQSDYI